MGEWSARPLDQVYAAIFIDAIASRRPSCAHGTTPDSRTGGRVGTRPAYAAIGVDLTGHKDVLGLWATRGDGTETADFWTDVLSELTERGVADVLFVVVCDGLNGLPDATEVVFPKAVVQTNILHLLRNTFRYAPTKDWGKLVCDLKPICGAPTRASAWRAFEKFEGTWSTTCPAIGRLWRDAWDRFAPFLDYDVEIRRILCSINAIDLLDARYRHGARVHQHLPAEQAALNLLHLATRTLCPHSTVQPRWTTHWKPTLDALTAAFADRMPPAEDT